MPQRETIYVVFFRTHYQVRIVTLTQIQFELLRHIKEGESVYTALQYIIEAHDLIQERVAHRWQEWKADWTGKGFFIER